MSHTRHSMSISQSLFSVFVLPALSSSCKATRPASYLARSSCRPSVSQRTFTSSTRQWQGFSPAPASPPSKDPKYKAPELRKPRDAEIRYRDIQLVNSEGRLDPPVNLRRLLTTINSQTHFIEQVTPDDPEDRNFIPVCKLVDKKAAYDQNKARQAVAKEAKKLQAKTGAAGVKTFEMSWAISEHDLSHRLERMKDFLAEGRRVEVVLAKKKGGRKATTEECEGVLQTIRDAVSEVPGAREVAGEGSKVMKLGAMTTLSFAGPPQKLNKSAKAVPGSEAATQQAPTDP